MTEPIRPPNVVLINCDDLGYGDLGCYGSEVNDTPALDAMAAEGVRFTDFYMASPVCSPSRAAMLTGCYPTRVGFGHPDSGFAGGVLFPGWSVGLNPDEVTFATLLQRQGYATQLVGKWHCGDQPEFLPTSHGFDHYYGIPYSNDMGRQVSVEGGFTAEQISAIMKDAGWDEGIQHPPLPLLEDQDVLEAQPDQASLTGRYVEQSIRFMRANQDRPFFLYFAHMYVHLPIYVQERFREASRNGDYGAAVASIDWATDRILFELRRLGLDEHTVVIFTSDNGALAIESGGSGSNAPLRGSKGSTWEGGQRVPCIVRWPGHVPAGQVCTEMATAMDLYPTIAGLCDVAIPDDRTIDGRNVAALLGLDATGPDDQREFFYIRGPSIQAVRVGRWKLHVLRSENLLAAPAEVAELYDLVDDPGETSDVAAEHPDVVAELQARVDAGRRALGDGFTGTTGSDVRPIGKVDNPVTLTEYDPDNPYFMAEYDLPHRG